MDISHDGAADGGHRGLYEGRRHDTGGAGGEGRSDDHQRRCGAAGQHTPGVAADHRPGTDQYRRGTAETEETGEAEPALPQRRYRGPRHAGLQPDAPEGGRRHLSGHHRSLPLRQRHDVPEICLAAATARGDALVYQCRGAAHQRPRDLRLVPDGERHHAV